MSYQSKYTGAEIDAGIDAAKAALPKNGGTMIGALILAGDPADDKGAVTKKYVDDAINNIVSTPGNDGEDGVSPTISVTEITGGHRITITDANGTQSFDIMNGKDGADGSGGDGSGDMLKSVYDADNDGTVDNAAKLGGKAASEYYGKENPPPYPVTSVNGMTGAVEIPAGGTGDMQKGVYDVDESGVVDDSERLGGKLPEEYAAADHVHDCFSYSTTEQLTGGKWIDGKPIYKRILTGSWVTGNSNAIQMLDAGADIETIIDLHGHLKLPSGSCYSLNCYHNGAVGSFMRLSWQGDTKNIKIDQGAWNGSSYAGSVYVIHFEYTKTTD